MLRRHALLLLAPLLLAPRVGEATVILPLSIEQMAVEAACVVRGKVQSTHAAWDTAHERIYTYTEIEILDVMHSPSALPKKVTVRTLGGEVGEVGMKVSGTEKFTPNEEVVVFLRNDPGAENAYQVVGMSQGKFSLLREAKGRVIAVPSTEGLALARPDEAGTLKVDGSHAQPSKIPLVELRQRVRDALSKKNILTPTQAPTQPLNTPAPATSTPPATDLQR